MLQSINGVPIIVSEHCLEETEERLFPVSKHRSKRIHKKLVKRFGSEFKKEPAVFQGIGRVIMHPVRYQELKNQLQASEPAVKL